ncbi:GNAT family N-acetyltransferase [Natrialba taiwanensis]|uniref:N-acetyltransferase GCN5 n=1 Tax=Natrialba taiwanensis DSM 12281 TaxID=1230458 RepID=M0AC43_9EURY|nr:GNAT family N-acetyltransferase [Natrialba taiwanensis]ELY95432.1 N-acetyltransferase GCN5 [Natrialba taiwanensis DSM 12281]
MAQPLTIRRYQAGDGPRVQAVHEAAMRDAGAYVEGVPDDDLETIPETYLETSGTFLVGTVDEELVATGALRPVSETTVAAKYSATPPDSTVELTRLRVAPEHQRRGYGRRLTAALERRARTRGATAIVLDTLSIQSAAQGLYETQGFELVHREPIEQFDDGVDLLVYRKELVESG